MRRSTVRPGDVLLNITGASIGRSCVMPESVGEANVNQHVCIIRCKGEVQSSFVQAMLELPRTQQQIRDTAAGGSREGLNYQQVAALSIPWLPDNAQRALEEIVRGVGAVVQRFQRLIAAKRELKRGLMQELLTGRRRFPEFASCGKWSTLPLGTLVKSASRPVVWDDAAMYKLVSIRRRNGGLFLREEKRGAEIKTKQLFTVRAGDFVLSRMQVVHGALALVPPEFDGLHVSGMYMILRPSDPEQLSMAFLHYLGHLPVMYRNVLLSCHGVHIEKMTFDPARFLKKKVIIPPTLAEQERIVEALDSFDREISLMEAQREQFELQKRALMQKLLSGEAMLPVGAGSAA